MEAATDKQTGPAALGMLYAAAVASWGWLLYHAHYHWGSESYYNFGWFVPFLGGYLLYRKLSDSPVQAGEKASPATHGLLIAALLAGAIFIGAVRLFNEANPFWRVPLWAHAMALLGLTCAALYLYGGWQGLRRFIFPFFFLLLALPWPWRVEQWIIHSLTGWVTQMTVICLNLGGYPAISFGNTIQIGTFTVGVDEACSGIRSLQSLVMIGLFVGEYYAFGLWRRLALLAGSILAVMLFNGLRALVLAVVTVEGDAEAFQFWHDFLGNANFIVSCILLFAFGEILSRVIKASTAPPAPVRWRLQGRRLPAIALGGVVFAFLLPELGVEAWYRYKESRNPPLPELHLEWPQDGGLKTSVSDIPETLREALEFDFGSQVALRWPDGLEASLYYYGYTGEDKMASVSSFGHSPEVCMTAMGGRLTGRNEPVPVELYGHDWQLQHYEFVQQVRSREEPVHVFWLVWEPRQMGVAADELGSLNRRNQWKLVASGRRDFGRQVILLTFVGEQRETALRKRVAGLIESVAK